MPPTRDARFATCSVDVSRTSSFDEMSRTRGGIRIEGLPYREPGQGQHEQTFGNEKLFMACWHSSRRCGVSGSRSQAGVTLPSLGEEPTNEFAARADKN